MKKKFIGFLFIIMSFVYAEPFTTVLGIPFNCDKETVMTTMKEQGFKYNKKFSAPNSIAFQKRGGTYAKVPLFSINYYLESNSVSSITISFDVEHNEYLDKSILLIAEKFGFEIFADKDIVAKDGEILGHKYIWVNEDDIALTYSRNKYFLSTITYDQHYKELLKNEIINQMLQEIEEKNSIESDL